MKHGIFSAAMLGFAITAVVATQPMAGGHSPVEKREAAMGVVGKSTGAIGDMLKGEKPFDAAMANQARENTGLQDLVYEEVVVNHAATINLSRKCFLGYIRQGASSGLELLAELND